MSRILRYQESIEKFIKNKLNTMYNYEDNNFVIDNLKSSNHLCGIILSTILNTNIKNSSFKIHGYYMAIAIDMIILLHQINSNLPYYSLCLGDKLNGVIINLQLAIYKAFHLNIEGYKSSKTHNVLNIILFSMNYLNTLLSDIIKPYKFQSIKRMIKSDILNIDGINTKDNKEKLQKMSKIDQDEMMTYTKNTYGNIGKLCIILGWVLGGGNMNDKEMMYKLEILGETFGIIIKICYDYTYIHNDINNSNKYTTNILINIGINDSFSLFNDMKTKFIEDALILNLFTHTTKEVVDCLETKVDKCLSKSKIDMKSTYSSFSK
jgi:hypothetical protein